jgi:hypothetical protein
LVDPLLSAGISNMNQWMRLLVFPCPNNPPINAHDCIVKIDACLANKMVFKAEINIYDGIDQAYRVYPNVFFFREPYTEYAGNHSNIFKWSGRL